MTLDTIHLGDCTGALASVVGSVPNPVIVTDPPFNVGYHYDEYQDRREEGEYYEWLADLFAVCPFVVIHYPEALYRISFQTGLFPERVVSWVYNSNTPRQHRDIAYFGIAPDFSGLGEYKNPTDRRVAALMAQGKKPVGYDWLYHDQVKNVSAEKCGHPCQMPLAVMLYVVQSLPADATIIDPFTGGGGGHPSRRKAHRPALRRLRAFGKIPQNRNRTACARLAAL